MNLGLTDPFVTLSADNRALSSVLGREVNRIWDFKFLPSNHLQHRTIDRRFAMTTGCVILSSWSLLRLTSLCV
jgi:hypothetical protein